MKTFTSIVIALFATQLAACNASSDAGSIASPHVTQAGTQSSRDVKALEDAIIGHWKTDEYDLFYGAGVLWRVEKGQPPDKLNYQITATDESHSLIRLRMTVPTGGHWVEITFSPDRKSFTSKFWVYDGEIKLPGWKAIYIGPEQTPPTSG